MIRHVFVCLAVAACLNVAQAAAVGDDAYFRIPLTKLQLTRGSWPIHEPVPHSRYQRMAPALRPLVMLDGEGEAYVGPAVGVSAHDAARTWSWSTPQVSIEHSALLIRAPRGDTVTGRLVIPKADYSGMTAVGFSVPATDASAEAQRPWEQARAAHYEALLRRGIPGAAWFRHQAYGGGEAIWSRSDRTARGGGAGLTADPDFQPETSGDLEATYALFSGGRALSENLQLDRVLPESTPGAAAVDLNTIEGITVAELDWRTMLAGAEPQKDALAQAVPADQHVVFFPSFDALIAVTDEAAAHGLPVLRVVDVRSEDARTQARYERQLGIGLTGLARLLGPKVVRSVALTGSDPYYRTGTDVALIFETAAPDALRGLLLTQIAASAAGDVDARTTQGDVAGLAYDGTVTPDRRICSYTAALDGAVAVTNSLAQLERLARVRRGEAASIASLPEYAYFRNRYRQGDAEESAFLFLSDATIRRWCGPRWRIAASRRTRAAALLAELTASSMESLGRRTAAAGDLHLHPPVPEVGDLRLTPAGVTSSIYGRLEFLTPIVELDFSRVTWPEAGAYGRWRDSYQRNWRNYFDPIGVRLTVRDDRLAADVCVMPLIIATRYRDYIDIARGSRIVPQRGDHHHALLHLAVAINPACQQVRVASNFLKSMTPGLDFDPLGWMGPFLSVYADDDAFWQDLRNVEWDRRSEFVQREYYRLPLALRIEVRDPLKLTMFLTALRGYVDQTAAGLTTWENVSYRERSYVRMGTRASASAGGTDGAAAPPRAVLCYAALPDALLITLSEPLMRSALDRDLARAQAAAGPGESPPQATASAPASSSEDTRPWLGTSLGLQMDQRFLDLVGSLTGDHYQVTMMLRAWGNIPILNEWKRLFPDQDPVSVHEAVWQTRLVCPGGGSYVWNSEWRTMESTVYGHPAAPRPGPAAPPLLRTIQRCNIGVDFEDQGLRARVELDRSVGAR